jgi:adenosine kinase
MGTVGRDFGDYRVWLQNAGVDCSTVRQIDEVFTASFFVNTDLDNNQIASFYSGAMAQARDYRISDAFHGKPDWVVISPNDPQAMVNLCQECRLRGLRFIYDPSQQVPRFNGDELLQSMDGAYMMVVNAYEAEVIAKKTGLTIDGLCRMINILVITQGKNGSHIFANDELIKVPAFPIKEIKDPTGVGDAYRAGLIRGLVSGFPLKLAGEIGALCAAYVLEQVGPQSHRFTIPEFIARFRANDDDQGLLDKLLVASTIG